MRVVVAQQDYRVGDIEGNVARIEAAAAQDTAVNARMQRFQPAVEHLGEAGVGGHLGHGNAAGGDGTISSMAGAIHDTQLPLAILPLGTANDLAKSIGIPDDLDQACEAIIAGHTRRIDLGKVNDHYFFNAVNLGLGTEITHELTQESKQQWGVLSYAKALLNAVRKRHAFTLNIGLDNRKLRVSGISG